MSTRQMLDRKVDPGEGAMARVVQSPCGPALRLATVRGIDVGAHWSGAVMVLLVTVLLAGSELPAAAPGASRAVYWIAGVGVALLFVVSLTAHELAHALVARHEGLPVHSLTVWMLGGLTDLGAEPSEPGIEARVAAAGPLTNMLIGAVLAVVVTSLGTGDIVGASAAWLAVMNIVLAAFNVLPAAPLDGGRLVHAVVWWATGDGVRATAVVTMTGRGLSALLMVLGLVSVLGGDLAGIWLAFVGWFIGSAATQERDAPRAEALVGVTAAALMEPVRQVVPSWWAAARVADEIVAAGHTDQAAFPAVDIKGRLVAAFTAADLQQAVATRQLERTARHLHRRRPIPVLPADAPAELVIASLQPSPHVAIVRDEDNRPIGTVEQAAVARLRRARQVDAARRAGHGPVAAWTERDVP